MLRKFLIAMILLTAVPIAHARDSYTTRSRYYVIESDLEPGLTREVGKHMDVVFREYMKRLSRGFTKKDNRKMRLYLFETRAGYINFLGQIGINGQGSGGMFFVRREKSGLAIWFGHRDKDEVFSTLQHEGFHQFAWMRIGHKLPVWANEGLAEYFGDAVIMRGKAVTGQIDTARLFNVKEAVKKNKHLSFNQLLNMSGDQWGKRLRGGGTGAGLQYDQSWSIVHFLAHARGNKYRQAFMKYLLLINRNRDPEDAYRKSFGGDSYNNFEKAWKDYILDLEADSLSIAVTRARFLAQGTRWLVENGQPAPESIEQLKAILQKNNYRTWRHTHGGKLEYNAKDDDLFEPPPPEHPRRKTELKLVENRTKGLPPEIVISGLSVDVRVEWVKRDDGAIVYEITYR